jgi:hypothetical protein
VATVRRTTNTITRMIPLLGEREPRHARSLFGNRLMGVGLGLGSMRMCRRAVASHSWPCFPLGERANRDASTVT